MSLEGVSTSHTSLRTRSNVDKMRYKPNVQWPPRWRSALYSTTYPHSASRISTGSKVYPPDIPPTIPGGYFSWSHELHLYRVFANSNQAYFTRHPPGPKWQGTRTPRPSPQ